jgi:hypothetical protein
MGRDVAPTTSDARPVALLEVCFWQTGHPSTWAKTDAFDHVGSRALEFAAKRNANLMIFADRNRGWNKSS